MNKMLTPARPRGLTFARAEGVPDLQNLIDGLNSAFETFKSENDNRIRALETKKADPLVDEKLGRINADIETLTKAIDESKRVMASLQVGAASDDDNPHALEHVNAFNKYFRRGVDANLAELQVKAALTTQSDPDGGYLVPVETEQAIDRVLGTVSVMRNLATVMPIGTSTYRKFVNVGGTKSGWVGEEETRPETGTPKLAELAFNVMEIYAFPFTTQQMLDDGIIDISQWLADEVNIEFAEQEGAAFITGDGQKKPRGILGYNTVADNNWSWGNVGFKVTGAAAGFAATNSGDAFIDLLYSLKQGYRAGATWLTSDKVMGDIRKFKDGQGNYIWAAPTTDMPATILGKPVETDDNMPALAANSFPVALGNFKRAYLILDRVGIRVMRHPYQVPGKVGFYTTKRVGGGIANYEALKLLKCSA